MPKRQADPSSISRREVLGAAAAGPASGSMSAVICGPIASDLVARCSEWLALDLEIDRLSLRWSTLETQAARDFDLFRLPSAARRALPMAAEMHDIDARLETLFKARSKGLKALRRMKPIDGHGAASKLLVAARASQYEGGEIHDLVMEAVEVLATLKCPACGAPYVPASRRPA